jgi:hypothetical protein
MSELEIYVCIVIGLAVCLMHWRAGFYICLAVGFLQDPVRKMVPEEPVYFSVLVGAFVAMTFVGAYTRGVRLSFRAIHAWNGALRLPLALFILLVVVQSFVTLINTGNAVLAGIGLLAYLTPLPAILLGYQFSRGEQDVIKFTKIYLAASFPMVSGIYLSYLGYEWDALRSVGEGLIAYSPTGDRLMLFSGFLRSPEIAAWHAGTSVCVLVMLSLVLKRQVIFKWMASLLVLFYAGALLLTGRRKFLVEIMLFASIYGVFLIWYKKGAIKSALAFAVLMSATAFVYAYLSPADFNTGISSYYQRGMSVQEDATERVSVMTLDSFQWVIAQNGLLGAGAGTGSQGAQYFGGGSDLVGVAAEGGLAKVLAELGIPGLVLLLWLVVSLVRYLWSIIVYVKDKDSLRTKLAYGLLAFLVSNAFVYVIAHQVFGDLFVLVLLGFFLGFVLAVPRVQTSAAASSPERKFAPAGAQTV